MPVGTNGSTVINLLRSVVGMNSPIGPLFDFPPLESADSDGFLCYGGELTPYMLISAYAQGIFPWFNEGEPVLWWSPDPRMVFYPNLVKPSETTRQLFQKSGWKVTYDHAFELVVRGCAGVVRKGQQGTWITNNIRTAYTALYKMGVAHSVEVWEEGTLIGGLYGLTMGRIFCGESMFHLRSGASKVAFWHLGKRLVDMGFILIDGQIPNAHLRNLGGVEMPREEFARLLKCSLENDEWFANW